MSQGNIYKPRYKIAFQAKSKIWPYKNSRLRRFFNIRGRKLVRRGLFKRYFLVFNNMKWTIARRYIRPYMKKRRPLRRRFRNVFYSKQQLRAFYGKQKEEAFRNFFKRFIGGAKGRNNMFAAALERRTDVFLFRLRFLPTIYACHQFIHHFGVDINGKKEKSPYALISPGDIVTFDKTQWAPFVEYVYERLYWRIYGLNVWKRRQFKSLRKKVWWCHKNKFFKKSNVSLMKKFGFVVRKVLKINNSFSQYIPNFYKEVKAMEVQFKQKQELKVKAEIFSHLKSDILFYWKEYRSTLILLIKKINRMYKKKWRLKIWSWRNYYVQYFNLVAVIFRLYKTLKFYFSKFKLLELNFYRNIILVNSESNWKEDMLFCNTLTNSTKDKLLELNSQISYYNFNEQILNKKRKKIKKGLIEVKNKYKFLFWASFNLDKFKTFIINKKSNNLKSYLNKSVQKKTATLRFIESELNKNSIKLNDLINERKSLNIKFNGQVDILNKNIKTKIATKKNLYLLINNQSDLIEQKFKLFNNKLEFLLNFIIKRRIKRYALKSRVYTDNRTGKKTIQKSPIIYFLTKRRSKKERKLALPRLKKVHWYIPSYIYFDARTLRAVFLYNPKPEEIVYSFKCSLRGIHSFYRSFGV